MNATYKIVDADGRITYDDPQPVRLHCFSGCYDATYSTRIPSYDIGKQCPHCGRGLHARQLQ